jgi:Xaa-Pro aminopeptidase
MRMLTPSYDSLVFDSLVFSEACAVVTTPTSTALDQQRIDRIRQALRANTELDAVILASPVNTWYASQVVIVTQEALPERLAVVVWPREGEPTYIVCNLEELQARAEAWIPDLRTYFEFQESPMQVVRDVLVDKGLTSARIGIETNFLTADYADQLRTLVPEAVLVPCQAFMAQVRSVKTDREITVMEQAASATDRAIRQTFESVHVGDTERSIAIRLQTALLEQGADRISFTVLAAGVNSVQTHPIPGDYAVRNGDVLRTDFGGAFPGGYHSDIARTMVIGRPSAEQLQVYRALWKVQEELIDMCRPGIVVSDIYTRARDLNLGAGLSFNRPHVGHSLGIEIHEPPMIHPHSTRTIEPNMVFAIEPNHLVPSVGKYHLEDLVLVTDGVPRLLSRTADWYDLLTVG